MPRVHASLVAEAALAPLLEEHAESLATVYLETATEVTWRPYSPDLVLAGVLRGRAFGSPCDIEFWRADDGFRVRLLTDLARPATNGESIDLAAYDAEDLTYALGGQFDPDAACWLEPGSARRWSYPLPETPRRVGVEIREYRDRASGDLHFVRYRRLVPFTNGEEAS